MTDEGRRDWRLARLLEDVAEDIAAYAIAVRTGEREPQHRERALLALGRLQMALGVK